MKRTPSKQKGRKAILAKEIKEIHDDSKQIYGTPKITDLLGNQAKKISEKYVGNIMKENNMRAHYIRPYTVTTKDCDFSNKLRNILKRDFNPKKPNGAWCTDITYVWTQDDGFVYLTSIMDLYSRRIIAWTLSDTLSSEAVLKCLAEAKQRRNTDDPIVIHSDRGVQFTSKLFKEMTEDMVTSYSDKGNPWDNACIESFHALIKREWTNRFIIQDYHHAYRIIFEYIEGFYNTVRIHSHCGYLSPNQFEKNYINLSKAS